MNSNPIVAAQEIQYFQATEEMTQVAQLRCQQMDLYNSLLLDNEVIQIGSPPPDQAYQDHPEEAQPDAMVIENELPDDNMDEDTEPAHHPDGGQAQ
jgi:hypothetical protein